MSVGDRGAESNGRRDQIAKGFDLCLKLLQGKLGILPHAENGEFMSSSSRAFVGLTQTPL